jgi:hypothetical protein
MPLVKWDFPQYEGHDVVEMVTVTPKPDHEDEAIGGYPEHVLMLLRDEYRPGVFAWGVAWLVHDIENDRWGQRLMSSGPSRDDGDTERRQLRYFKEKITGRMG